MANVISDEVQTLVQNAGSDHINETQLETDIYVVNRYANEYGLSQRDIDALIDIITNSSLDEALFKQMVLSLIPKDGISEETVKKIMFWVFINHRKAEEENVDCILYWIAGLLDYKLLDKQIADPYYNIIFKLLEYYPKPVSHLLYILTKPEDVQYWRAFYLSNLITKVGSDGYLCTLMNLFKQYNPNAVPADISYCKSDNPFSCRTKFYVSMRNAIKSAASKNALVPYASGNVTITNKPKISKAIVTRCSTAISNGVLESCYDLNHVTNGMSIVKHFRNSEIPSQALAMIQNDAGIWRLAFGDVDLQLRLTLRLYVTLEEVFITGKIQSTDSEKEDLLKRLINLQQFCLHGFKSISKFLKMYLKFWNGYTYRKHILKLIEWFTFKSEIELNRNLLYPLYMIFVSSNPEEMCEIIRCITSFVINLYTYIDKEQMDFNPLFARETMLNSEDLIRVLQSLSKYFTHLCNIALYAYPCNCNLLTTVMFFYEKVHIIERNHTVPIITITPPIVIYQCLFSFNCQLLNRISSLLLKYDRITRFLEPNVHQDVLKNLDSFLQDIYNCIWASCAFDDRSNGFIFSDLTTEDSNQWAKFVNLNTAFHITNHIMFSPHQYNNILKHRKFRNKEDILEAFQLIVPDLVKLIRHVETKQEDIGM